MIVGAPHATCYFNCHQASIGPRNDFGAALEKEAPITTFRGGAGKKETGQAGQLQIGIQVLRKDAST
jgi:hypothetical protein